MNVLVTVFVCFVTFQILAITSMFTALECKACLGVCIASTNILVPYAMLPGDLYLDMDIIKEANNIHSSLLFILFEFYFLK